MERRTFLKGVAATPVLFEVARNGKPSGPRVITDRAELAPFTVRIDVDHKVIHLLKRCSGQALYSYLMDKWDDEDMMDQEIPMHALSPVLFRMENGWRLAEPERVVCDVAVLETGVLNNG